MELDTSGFESSLSSHLSQISKAALDEAHKAAYEIRNQAVARTPVNSGALRSAWQVRNKRTSVYYEATIYNNTKYAKSIEYGTKPRTITAKNKKVLANKKTGQVFGKSVRHPGSKAQPMLRPAVKSVMPKLQAALKRLI
jgi:hypothetical protein